MTLSAIFLVLQMAISLLVSAQNPLVSQPDKIRALQFAQTAVELASQAAGQASSTPLTIPVAVQPVVPEPIVIPNSSITEPPVFGNAPIVPVIRSLAAGVPDNNQGYYYHTGSALLKAGEDVVLAVFEKADNSFVAGGYVQVVTPDSTQNRTIYMNNVSSHPIYLNGQVISPGIKYARYLYTATQSGTITFTSGELTASIDVTVR
jgi:hypothetical protein